MKRNKIRYKSTPKPRVELPLSGNVYLQYRDDEAIDIAQRGDLMVYPKCEQLHTLRRGEYDSTGFSGYFKVDVNDGKQWCLVLTQSIFPESENYFSKTECPIDTYALCEEILVGLKGKTLLRTYREHYALEEDTPQGEE